MKDNKTSNISEKEFLSTYDLSSFDRPSVAVDIVLFTLATKENENQRKVANKALKVLLIKRNEHPFKDHWALPGGFVRMDESLDEAAYRELLEESGARGMYLEQIGTYGEVNRDPRGRIISTAYMALVDEQTVQLTAGTDASEAKWFELSYEIESKGFDTNEQDQKVVCLTFKNNQTILSSSILITRSNQNNRINYKPEVLGQTQVAFDHSLILYDAVNSLRNQVDSGDIVFQLMPEYFTLTELQRAYETILGKKLIKANFRRKISGLVTETDKYNSASAHRPSKLYVFNKA